MTNDSEQQTPQTIADYQKMIKDFDSSLRELKDLLDQERLTQDIEKLTE